MDIFHLDDEAGEHFDPWVDGLRETVKGLTNRIDVRGHESGMAARAAWTGEPFVVAGSRGCLQAWIEKLDPPSIEVIQNHAYFWLLTSSRGFRHRVISESRLTVLDWERSEYNVIRDALKFLNRFPRLSGLSNDMQHLREEILRVGAGKHDPGSPVLILGESGSGKEGTAISLFEASSRPPEPGLHAMGGAGLDLDPGMSLSELFGIERSVATGVNQRAGLLEKYSHGAIFVDDFETAPKRVQEALLRLTSTPKGKLFGYCRTGGRKLLYTDVWLIFSTNADIVEMLKEGTLRMDFLFRFEDRVIVVPPLRARPADIPAIARHIWAGAVKDDTMVSDRVLPWRSLRDIVGRKLRWRGNVREVAALLGLAVSMGRMPWHRRASTGDLLSRVLSKGGGYLEWFDILASKEFTAPQPDRVREILSFDSGSPAGGLSPCQERVRSVAGDGAWRVLRKIVDDHFKKRRGDVLRSFCRCLDFALSYGSVTVSEATLLSGLKVTQVNKHLKLLTDSGPAFLVRSDGDSGPCYAPAAVLRPSEPAAEA